MTSKGAKNWHSGTIPLISPDLLGEIISTAADLAIVISDLGEVLSVLVNPNHPSFGRLDHWAGRDIRECLTRESRPKLDQYLSRVTSGETAGQSVELNHADSNALEFPIRYSFHQIGPDGAILMLGRDLRPVAEVQQQLVKAQLALERDYETQREYDTRYRVLMDASRDAMIFVSMGSGRIVDLNTAGALMLGAQKSDLLGSALAQEFDGRRRGEFLESLTNSAIAESTAPVQLIARRSRRAMVLHPTVFRAAGERFILCRLDPTEGETGPEDELAQNLSALFHEGSDAIVFTDISGKITAANDAFLNLSDSAHLPRVKERHLADFLARGSVDFKVLAENAERNGVMRMYGTKILTEFGAQLPVEIAASYLSSRSTPTLVFVIRDASRAETLRRSGVTMDDDGVKSVMELVGSASLKDIVSETTDVVEKMCIETAIELTNNNRVAAAEMLGLSRQSLYVKLRKFGLIGRDD
ncbi:MAG: transcriptional regulator PpsR [Rhodobacteraceae bacterium]|nr:transcriptional regulator PpsR [Paracoccaceae bacterium]